MKTPVLVSVTAGLVLLAGTALAQDVLKVSPATNKVLVENQYVRVLESTFRPGAKELVHTHPAGWYYVTRAGTLKVTYASGRVEMWTPKVGEQAWMDGEEAHSAENVGKTTLQYILVEVKAEPSKTPN